LDLTTKDVLENLGGVKMPGYPMVAGLAALIGGYEN